MAPDRVFFFPPRFGLGKNDVIVYSGYYLYCAATIFVEVLKKI